MLAVGAGLLLAVLPAPGPALSAQIRLVGTHQVELELRNTGDARFDRTVHTGFRLTPRTNGTVDVRDLWAPVDPGSGASYGANRPPALVLEPGAVRRARVDLHHLFWQLSRSSFWPNQSLLDVAERATYRLAFDLELEDPTAASRHESGPRVRSNEVMVTLEGRAQRDWRSKPSADREPSVDASGRVAEVAWPGNSSMAGIVLCTCALDR
jgi:hypothetical protein